MQILAFFYVISWKAMLPKPSHFWCWIYSFLGHQDHLLLEMLNLEKKGAHSRNTLFCMHIFICWNSARSRSGLLSSWIQKASNIAALEAAATPLLSVMVLFPFICMSAYSQNWVFKKPLLYNNVICILDINCYLALENLWNRVRKWLHYVWPVHFNTKKCILEDSNMTVKCVTVLETQKCWLETCLHPSVPSSISGYWFQLWMCYKTRVSPLWYPQLLLPLLPT